MPSITRRRQRVPKARWLWLVLTFLLAGGIASVLICANGAAVLLDKWLQDLPDYSDRDAFEVSEPTTIYANDGETVLASLYLQNRQIITKDEVSQYVIDGTIATEDSRFYQHNGIDLAGIGRAIISNITGSSVEGASTITQQLIRNTILLDEMEDMTIKRKVREAYLAMKMEELYTKDEILMMYLNTIYYGNSSYGIQAAAQSYFSKDAKDLTLSESAMLVGIVQSPVALDPTYDYDASLERSHIVLERMLANNYITQEEYDAAIKDEPKLNVSDNTQDGIVSSPYFVTYVRDQLIEEYGYDVIFQGGLKVYTTLDPDLQKAAEKAAKDGLSGQDSSLECALVSVDPDNGYIVAMVGGKDFYKDQYNLATQAQRQPGSAFKTFTMAAAIELGISPSMAIDASTPAVIKQDSGEVWRCYNSGYYTYGTMTMTSALKASTNVVFARVAHAIGAKAIVDMAHRLGITSDLDEVESITLGVSGCTPLEMASAYATLAAGGVYNKPVAWTKIVDRDDNTIYEWESSAEEVLDKKVAVATVTNLEAVVTGGTAYSARLSNGQESGGKTGTSEYSRDCWYIGITPQLSTAIWIGTRVEATVYWNGYQAYGENCCPIWKDYMTQAFAAKKWKVTNFPTAESPTYDSSWSSKFERPSVTVASLKGKSLSAAKTTAEGLGYDVSVKEQYSDTVAEGIVISASISGGKVVIVVSKGPDQSKVTPDDNGDSGDNGNGDNDNGDSGDDDNGDGGDSKDDDSSGDDGSKKDDSGNTSDETTGGDETEKNN